MSIRDLFKTKPTNDLPDKATGKIIHLEQPSEASKGGYGFISSDDLPFTRIYFHWHQLIPGTLRFSQLTMGMEVEFQPVDIPGSGIRALKIKVKQ